MPPTALVSLQPPAVPRSRAPARNASFQRLVAQEEGTFIRERHDGGDRVLLEERDRVKRAIEHARLLDRPSASIAATPPVVPSRVAIEERARRCRSRQVGGVLYIEPSRRRRDSRRPNGQIAASHGRSAPRGRSRSSTRRCRRFSARPRRRGRRATSRSGARGTCEEQSITSGASHPERGESGSVAELDAVDRLVRADVHVRRALAAADHVAGRGSRLPDGGFVRRGGRRVRRSASPPRTTSSDQLPVSTKSILPPCARCARFRGTMAFSPSPPPCMNRTPVVRGHREQLAQVGLGLGRGSALNSQAAMAHLHHAHAAAVPVEHLGGLPGAGPRLRQRRRARRRS